MELNAETIKKALECCSDCDCYNAKMQEDCPLINVPFCKNYLRKQSLALIKSQEQRIGAQDMTISELRKLLGKANHDVYRYAVKIKELAEENERLKASRCYIHPDGRLEMIPSIETVRADTVRKVCSLCKKRAKVMTDAQDEQSVAVDIYDIDQIAKEMLEGANEN